MHEPDTSPPTNEQTRAASPGKVYLVGAGPGDPELITVKGLRALRSADVVIYDHLIHPALLRETHHETLKIYAGKSAGQHTLKQKEINKLLVQYASDGKIVVRLKGGDPFVFGRGGEEASALVQHGIAWEVIPGITSALAAPAYAGIPVTHREYAAAFTVVTGHAANTKDAASAFDWEALAHLNGTIILLMGIGNLPLITEKLMYAGRAATTPVAVVRWGSTSEQQSIIGTLETIAQQVRQAHITSPAVIVIGDVVHLHQQLQWFQPDLMPAYLIQMPDDSLLSSDEDR